MPNCSRCGAPFISPPGGGRGRPRTRCDGCRSNHDRAGGTAWRILRARVLAEEPYCYRCGADATEVDHVIPLSVRPDLAHERSNLRGACKSCNASKGARLDGAPIPTRVLNGFNLNAIPESDPCTCPPGCRCHTDDRGPHVRHLCL